MKLKRMTLENFRGYKSPVSVTFDNMTAFIGKNDAGKSTILEALDIFFNDGKGLIKLDKKDINIDNQGTDLNEIRISLSFSELPKKIIIDETNETELSKEYLLNKYGELEIIKLLKPTDGKPTVKTFIRANHPANPNCKDLLLKKNKELAKITTELGIECNKVKNAEMRAAIWKYYHDDLQLEEYEIDVSTKDSDIKSVWEKLQTYLPYYSLFQSDRKNTDSDDEVQDPLKEAVKQILSSEELREQLRHIAEKVKRKLQEVSDLTLEKIKEINPEIANTLHPNIPSPESLKWGDVFKGLSIYGDDIPINKRGSGVKRLILLNFFRAQAEKKKDEKKSPSIIYAIEEPETSQHVEHQNMLIDALNSIAEHDDIQVILTTHSANIVKKLGYKDLRLIMHSGTSYESSIEMVSSYTLPYTSLNEVNYMVFGEVTEEFHNELYGFLQKQASDEVSDCEHEKEFEKWLIGKGCSKLKDWIRVKNKTPSAPYKVTLQTFIRNSIHHPENTENTRYTSEELKNSIIEMMEIATTLSN